MMDHRSVSVQLELILELLLKLVLYLALLNVVAYQVEAQHTVREHFKRHTEQDVDDF